MGEGMTVFLEKDVGSMDQWDLVRGGRERGVVRMWVGHAE